MYVAKVLGGLAVVIILIAQGTQAQAQDRPGYQNAPILYSGIGASISVGGGVVGFSDQDMRDFASLGGAWDARLVFGTRQTLALEAAYTGGANRLEALGLDDNATLLSTGFEVLGRVNLANEEWQPYVVAGLGVRNYSVVNSNTNTSSVAEDENLGEVPLGGGMAYRYRGLIVDARALFRAAFYDDLIETRVGQDRARLHSWQTQLTVGYEF